ncbi:hypothetical protein IE4803_PC00064 (plasmid) [Rhizobium etli bv. phaseoli str. IE4803]|nr:hypothetical protein IE4803_PC00064 [Rhizobium etli bv. phaseoli str. IE4803]
MAQKRGALEEPQLIEAIGDPTVDGRSCRFGTGAQRERFQYKSTWRWETDPHEYGF